MTRLKSCCFIFLGCILAVTAKAQEILTSAGGQMSDDQVQVNWTIGEAFIETFSNNGREITSGLNQPVLNIITGAEKNLTGITLSIYPNPTSRFVEIKYEGSLPIAARLISNSGELLLNFQINHNSTLLDLTKYATGLYMIEVTGASKRLAAFKIIKQ